MANSSYLVALFCASAGKNGEDLGVDEEQIILFVYLLFDVPNNKVSFYLLFIIFTNRYFDTVNILVTHVSRSLFISPALHTVHSNFCRVW